METRTARMSLSTLSMGRILVEVKIYDAPTQGFEHGLRLISGLDMAGENGKTGEE